MAVPLLFDRDTLAARRVRAARAPADFLLRCAAEEIADRLTTVLRDFERVVEVGSLSTTLREAIPRKSGGTYLRLGPAAGMPDIVADEEALPLAPETFDLAVSALSLQAVNDLPGALAQIRRTLKPDGLFLAALLGGATLTELRQSFTRAEAEIEGGASPRVFPFGDVRDFGALLQRAGFALPVTDSDSLTVRYADAFALMADLRAMGGTNILAARRRAPTRRTTIFRMAEIYRERFADADGRIRATFEIVYLSGWAPHESQQNPLKPGSAKVRLADALGTREIGPGPDSTR
jgi:SAM-dependent methyltransferase